MRTITLAALLACALPAHASDEKNAFVESNILAVFYHELGHAVIDIMEVPIFGQEEDAADVMSVLLIDWIFEEDTAQAIAYDSALGFLSDPEGLYEIAYWDVHGPDEQRFYNHVCLFYGANPDDRDDLANDLGLPEDRAEYCPEEYDLAAESWGLVFDTLEENSAGVPMTFQPGTGPGADIINQVLGAEVKAMNDDLLLPHKVQVTVESCGEPNAFYDPSQTAITFCTEFIAHFEAIYDQFASE